MRLRASLLAVIPLVLAGLWAVASPASARLYGGYYDWKTVSAGGNQTCLTRTNGKLYCWGTDGTGSSLYAISGASDWTSVSAGAAHQCAIRASGVLYCWGDDSSGQVGNGAGGSPTVTAQITTFTNWTRVSAGDSHTCAIRAGTLFCWGSDASGQIGNGDGDNSPTSPQQITASATWTSVSAGGSHTCAIRSVGILYCWGNDDAGQVGNGGGTGNGLSVPQQITTATDWKSVSAGATHTCAIRSTGKLYCWGNDANGQLGNGSGGSSTIPIQITSAADWKSVSAGGTHTCALRGSGIIYCWGADNYNQSVEGGAITDVDYPQKVGGSYTDWKSIDAGANHTCALRGGGALYCWGAQSLPSNGSPAGSGYPGTLLNLKPWKLTTPVDGADADTYADEIKQPTLDTYRNAAFFHNNASNSAVVFRAPVGGAKTPGSVFARSELRGMYPYDGAQAVNYNWTSGTHVLTMNEAFTHLPAKVPKVVGMQIHDPDHEVLEIVLYGPRLYAYVRRVDGTAWEATLDPAYTLGTRFNLKVTANSGGIFVDYNGVRKGSFTGRVPGGSIYWFFKAGCYLQTNTTKGDAPNDFGETIIYSLTTTHS
ncbi:MAG TPA: polysaccharide lyase family 7 protein [Aeromicrobium sp.]|nr:polysaccharide lyase family 7 protein [Aeromicrobium sp.]